MLGDTTLRYTTVCISQLAAHVCFSDGNAYLHQTKGIYIIRRLFISRILSLLSKCIFVKILDRLLYAYGRMSTEDDHLHRG